MSRDQILREESLLLPGEQDPRLLAAPSKRWRHVLSTADKFRPEILKLADRAFARVRAGMRGRVLTRALQARDEARVMAALNSALRRSESTWRRGLPKLLTRMVEQTGIRTARSLARSRRAIRAAATPKIKGFKFDVTNPRALKWAKDHAAETIEEVSETTRTRVKRLIEDSFEKQIDPRDIADELEHIVGEDRAETIARTETMRAANQGQLEAWNQAVDEGLLTGNEEKEWIVTPDDRLCPVCEPMDRETVPLDGDFDVDGEKIDAPPAHPRCRCTMGITSGG